MRKNNACQCEKCVNCCWNSPGWFGSVEEVIGAAKIMKMPVEEFCEKYLIREWWAGKNESVVLPAPRKNFKRMTEANKKVKKLRDELPFKFDLMRREERINGKGFVHASWAHNLMSGYACVFLDKNNKCRIHESKPLECRSAFACVDDKKDPTILREKTIYNYWNKHQVFIQKIIKKVKEKKLKTK